MIVDYRCRLLYKNPVRSSRAGNTFGSFDGNHEEPTRRTKMLEADDAVQKIERVIYQIYEGKEVQISKHFWHLGITQ